MRRLALAVACALVFAGVALADAPTSITVTRGTWLHGDAQSLAAVDGDTLDIQAVWDQTTQRYRASFIADYPPPSGLTGLYWAAWASHGIRCHIYSGGSKVRKTLTTGTFYPVGQSSQWGAWCKSLGAFTLHWDELTTFSR